MNIDPIVSRDDQTAKWVTLQAIKDLYRELERVKTQLATITRQNSVVIQATGEFLAESGATRPTPVPQEFRLFRQTRAATGQSDLIWYSAQSTPGVWQWNFLIEV